MTIENLNTLPNMIILCANRYFGQSFDTLPRQQQQIVIDTMMLYTDMNEAEINTAFNLSVTSNHHQLIDAKAIQEQQKELSVVISTLIDSEMSQPA
tara:strand:- start:233 stop:520 length:288 start_codon:yes stop_codon:yes gene_type:complete